MNLYWLDQRDKVDQNEEEQHEQKAKSGSRGDTCYGITVRNFHYSQRRFGESCVRRRIDVIGAVDQFF